MTECRTGWLERRSQSQRGRSGWGLQCEGNRAFAALESEGLAKLWNSVCRKVRGCSIVTFAAPEYKGPKKRFGRRVGGIIPVT